MSQENPKFEVEDEMQRFMQLYGFTTLSEVLETPPATLLKMDGFGYRMLNHYFFERQFNVISAD